MRYTIAGCGAVGSKMAVELCKLRDEFTIVDFDTVELNNMGNSAYTFDQLGMDKTQALAELLYAKGAKSVKIVNEKVEGWLGKYVDPSDLTVVSFDNLEARGTTIEALNRTIHIGVGGDPDEFGNLYPVGEWRWDDTYTLPPPPADPNAPRLCTNELGAPIIAAVVGMARLAINSWMEKGDTKSGIIFGTGTVVSL